MSVLANSIYEALQVASFERRKEHLLGKPTLRADEQDLAIIDQKLSGVREVMDVFSHWNQHSKTRGAVIFQKAAQLYESLKIDNLPEDTEK